MRVIGEMLDMVEDEDFPRGRAAAARRTPLRPGVVDAVWAQQVGDPVPEGLAES